MKILLVDQFSGITPYELSRRPMTFEELIALVQKNWDQRAEELMAQYGAGAWLGQAPEVLDVDEKYQPPFATTTFRAGDDGMAEVWRYRWDSSG